MTTRTRQITVRAVLRLACLCIAAGASIGPALAQSSLHDPSRTADAMRRADPAPRWNIGSGAVSIVDMGATGPNQRPRHALRMRFDGATRAMRNLGVEADECSSLVRSSTRMHSSQPGGPERLRVSVTFAVSCRFF